MQPQKLFSEADIQCLSQSVEELNRYLKLTGSSAAVRIKSQSIQEQLDGLDLSTKSQTAMERRRLSYRSNASASMADGKPTPTMVVRRLGATHAAGLMKLSREAQARSCSLASTWKGLDAASTWSLSARWRAMCQFQSSLQEAAARLSTSEQLAPRARMALRSHPFFTITD